MRRGRKRQHILLFDAAGACLGAYAPAEFPMPREVVTALSVHYFDDPEPCHIHRAAVLVRAMEELLQDREVGMRYPIDALPAQQRRYFDARRVWAFAVGEADVL